MSSSFSSLSSFKFGESYLKNIILVYVFYVILELLFHDCRSVAISTAELQLKLKWKIDS